MLIKVNDIHLNFEISGYSIDETRMENYDQPVVIAIPGGPGFSHTFLKPALDPLSHTVPLIYLDPRGTGKSDLSTPADWNIPQMAEDIVAFCNALHIQKPILFGHSAGSTYAAAAAKRAPQRIQGLILSNSITGSKEEIFDNLIRLGGQYAKRLMIDLDAEGFADFAEHVLPLYDPVSRSKEHADTLDLNIEQCMTMLHECMETDVLELIKDISVPCHFFFGAHDPIFQARPAIQKLEALSKPHMHWQLFDHSGHDALLCEPELMIQRILDCIQKVT